LPHWNSRRHFFAAAAEAMRRILIERARQKRTLKRGGDRERIELAVVEPSVLPMACEDILGLDEALQKLQQKDARKAELVKLRFFAGLTTAQAAQALGVSTTTAENDWTYARSWLRLEMSGDGISRSGP
jgi:RNA polymerase sigma factor (TIGR02999 family)